MLVKGTPAHKYAVVHILKVRNLNIKLSGDVVRLFWVKWFNIMAAGALAAGIIAAMILTTYDDYDYTSVYHTYTLWTTLSRDVHYPRLL